MTHDQLTAAVRASELLAPTRAQRHGVYRDRKPRHVSPLPLPLPALPPAHVFVLPRVHENGRSL